MGNNSQTSNLMNQGFIALIGNESNAKFWNDNRTNRESLKIIFPRTFALTHVKEDLVAKFGHWDNGIWKWEVELRRQIFGWETEV